VKPLQITRHARNRMRWRRIAEEDIVDCIRKPETTRSAPSGEVNCWKVVKGRWLRVVYIEGSAAITVVTVICPAKPPEEERT
jgi:hypothetical protein